MKSLLAAVVFVSLGFMSNALADAQGPNAKQFEATIEAFRQACVDECQAPFKRSVAFDAQQPDSSELPIEDQTRLQNVAFTQAQVWGDTILEGDYYSNGETKLDRVVVLFENDVVIGYKITYSEQAWFIGECDFDYNNEATLKDCQMGRIQESTFVAPDFKTFFRDEDDFADFSG